MNLLVELLTFRVLTPGRQVLDRAVHHFDIDGIGGPNIQVPMRLHGSALAAFVPLEGGFDNHAGLCVAQMRTEFSRGRGELKLGSAAWSRERNTQKGDDKGGI